MIGYCECAPFRRDILDADQSENVAFCAVVQYVASLCADP